MSNLRMPNTFETTSEFEIANRLLELESEAKEYKDRKLNIYLAGPWFDDKSKIMYHTVQSIEKALRKHSFFNVFYPRDNSTSSPKETFVGNVQQINECDIVVAIVSTKDVGTAWEIGMAYAQGKEIYLLGYDESTFLSHTNLMLAFTGKCFTIDKWWKFLTVGLREEDFVSIPDLWEGIE